MILDILKYTFTFILLLCLQIYILDNIPNTSDFYLFEKADTRMFFFFLLMLPQMPAWAILLTGFVTGLIFDAFYQTYGINAAACVLIAYMRLPLLRFLKEDKDEDRFQAHINYLGFSRFFFYVAVISFVYHFCVTFLDAFSFNELPDMLLRIGAGTLFSVILIYLLDIIFFYRKAAR